MIKKTLILVIYFNYNNIFFTITNLKGNILTWNSLGFNKLKGTKKINVNSIKNNLKTIMLEFNNNFFHIRVKGFSKYKKLILKNLKESNLKVLSIYDETSIPHNGCKLIKNRRI